MLKPDRVSSTCDCVQSQVKWNGISSKKKITITRNKCNTSCFKCVCLFLVLWQWCVWGERKKQKVSRSRTGAIPNMAISSLTSRMLTTGNRLQQWLKHVFFLSTCKLWKGGTGCCQRAWCACVLYPRWFADEFPHYFKSKPPCTATPSHPTTCSTWKSL